MGSLKTNTMISIISATVLMALMPEFTDASSCGKSGNAPTDAWQRDIQGMQTQRYKRQRQNATRERYAGKRAATAYKNLKYSYDNLGLPIGEMEVRAMPNYLLEGAYPSTKYQSSLVTLKEDCVVAEVSPRESHEAYRRNLQRARGAFEAHRKPRKPVHHPSVAGSSNVTRRPIGSRAAPLAPSAAEL